MDKKNFVHSERSLYLQAKKFVTKRIDKILFKNMSREEIFTHILKKNRWERDKAVDLELTKTLREELPQLLKKLQAKSILDIPCGDFWWLSSVDLGFLDYTGVDIVKHVIQNDTKQYANEKRRFLKLDLLNDDLPKADIIFCKDLFIHLPLDDCLKSIKNIKKSGAKYFLADTHPSVKENKDIHTGMWRPLNLNLSPFFFPEPEYRIEMKTLTKGLEKEIDLWQIKNLP